MDKLSPTLESDMDDSDDDDFNAFDRMADFQRRPLDNPEWATPKPAQYLTRRVNELWSADRASDMLSIYGETQVLNAASDATGPQIRLLQLLPGPPDQPLRAKLVSRPVFDAPQYTALSYSWGDANKTKDLIIDRVAFPISQHLWDALRRLQSVQQIVNVWVDAICINQQNVIDKAAQVQIMAQIYNAAEEVKIWLGNPERKDNQDGDDRNDNPAFDSEFFLSLCQWSRPWWKRLWVVQECAHARACPIVMIGDSSMTLHEFIELWLSAANGCADLNQWHSLQANLEYLRMPYKAWTQQASENKHRIPLFERLRETSGRQCTDPRDRVYALLSLISESEAQELQPDYRKSYDELWVEVMKLVNVSEHPLGSISREKLDSVLPSLSALSAQIASLAAVGDQGGVRDFLIANALPSTILQDALQQAAEHGHLEVVKLLLDTGAEVNFGSSGKSSSSIWGLPAQVRNIGSATADASTALSKASGEGHLEIMRLLLDAGAAVDAHLTSFGDNALQKASSGGHHEAVKLLLSAGARFDGRRGFYSALHNASAAGRLEMVELLLDAGAHVNDHSYQGGSLSSLLIAASSRAQYGMNKMLLFADGTIREEERYLVSVRSNQAMDECHDFVKLLLGIRANDYVDAEYRSVFEGSGAGYLASALAAASVEGNPKIVRRLLQAGAWFHRYSHYIETVTEATSRSHREVVKLLADADACFGGRNATSDSRFADPIELFHMLATSARQGRYR